MKLRLLAAMLRAASLRADPQTAPRLQEFATELASLEQPPPSIASRDRSHSPDR